MFPRRSGFLADCNDFFRFAVVCSLLSAGTVAVRANVPGGIIPSATTPVTLTSGANGPTMSNGIVQLVFTTNGAIINQINYTYNNGAGTVTKKMLSGGKDGGEFYWEFGGLGSSTWTYSDVVDPSTTSGTYAEIAFTSVATGSAAAGDIQVNFSMLKGSPGFYVTLTLSHHAGDIATGLGEMRTNIYTAPDLNWNSVNSVLQRIYGINSTFVPAYFSTQENSLCNSGIDAGVYDDKYKYSADWGNQRVWGLSSVRDPTLSSSEDPWANVGLWYVLASTEYYNGGPLKPELMDAPLVNMLNGGHYYMGADSNWAANEDWHRVQGPFFIYLNSIPTTTTDPVQASQALYNDAAAQAAAEATAWPYAWYNNATYDHYYMQASNRGTVTGQIVINDRYNPYASAANLWVGVVAQPSSPDGVYDFQEWYKPFQFWTKTDANGNFTIPNVIATSSIVAASGSSSNPTYTLYAFGPGGAGTFMSQSQNGGNPPWSYSLPATPFAVNVTASGTTSLGTVTWTPNRVAPTVFEIGYPDRTARKFRHGDDFWVGDVGPNATTPSPIWTKFLEFPNDFPNGLNYVVGTNKWPTDWNFIQPIAVSSTGGDNNTSSTITFTLPSAPASTGTASLYVAIASDYYGAVNVSVNGSNLGGRNGVTASPSTFPASGYIPAYTLSDSSIREQPNGAISDERIQFPATLLKAGTNTIVFSLRQVGGSYFADHFMYDYIRLELSGYVPPAPSSVTAFAANKGTLLSWPATPGAVSYNVLRTVTSGSDYTAIASGTGGVVGPVCGSGAGNATFVDATATNGDTYYYVVQSVNTTGTSANSVQSNGVTPSAANTTSAPATPTGITAAGGTGSVTLTWNASAGADYYTIERSTLFDRIPQWTLPPSLSATQSVLSTVTLNNAVTGTTFTDTALTNGTKYLYYVLASNAAGTSGSSTGVEGEAVPTGTLASPAVTVKAGAGSETLSWNAVPGATGYIIEQATAPGGPYTYISSISALTYTITGLENGTPYYYVVLSMNAGGSTGSTVVSGTTPAGPPASVTASPGNTEVELTWPAVSGATGYTVESATVSGGPYTIIGTPVGPSFVNAGLTNGTTYYYVVATQNENGTGPVSTEASATPSASLAVAPANLTATATNGDIALAWDASTGATSYQLYRGTSNGGPYTAQGPAVTTTGETDTEVLGGVTYYYVVAGINGAGTGAYSNQASANLGGVASVIWTGSSSSAWDTSTLNWVTSGGAAVTYSDGLNAIFGDGAVTGTVTIGAAVNPAGVAFSNSSLGYTLNSTGPGISGDAAVIKSGNAEVLLTGSESYTGGTTISSGTYAQGADSSTNASTIESPGLNGGTNASLGSSGVLVESGGQLRFGGHGGPVVTYIIPNPITINGATLQCPDGVQEFIGGIDIGSGGATMLTSWSGKNIMIESAFSGTGPVTIDDWQASGGDTSGGLVEVTTGSNAYSGAITIDPPSTGYLGGVLNIANNTALINASIIDNNTSAAGLEFNATAPQIGALSGPGNITLPSGGLTAGGNGASTTYSGVLSGAGGFTKAGAGTMILSNSDTYTGATTVTGGILEITGTVTGSTSASISSGAVLYVAGGGLNIAGSITNNGTVKISGSGTLALSGEFINYGVFDLIDGPNTIPSGFVNDGTVLNANSVQVTQVTKSGAAVTISIEGYALHTYQLEKTASLTAPIAWTNVGASVSGTGGPLVLSDPSATGSNGFYRILTSP